MATKYGPWAQDRTYTDTFRFVIDYTATNINDTQARIDVTLKLEAKRAASNLRNWAGNIKIAGTAFTWSGFNHDFPSAGTVTITTATKTVSRTKATQSVAISAASTNTGSWDYNITVSVTQSVSPKTSYTVTYNANGGAGAPAAQTKWYGEALSLTGSTPKPPSGRTFLGWATTATGTPTYGKPWTNTMTYTGNAPLNLYAIYGYLIKLNLPDEGTTFASVYKMHGRNCTLPSATPAKANCAFLGWNTSINVTGTNYAPGASFGTDAATTLYAAFVGVTGSATSPERTDAQGGQQDDGTYAKVGGSYSIIARLLGTVTVTGRYRVTGASSWKSIGTIQTDRKSETTNMYGSITDTVFGGAEGSADELDLAKTYQVELTVTFAYTYGGASRTATKVVTTTLPMAYITMEFLRGGHGVTFGKPATQTGLHSYMPATFHELVRLDKALRQHASELGDTKIGVDVPSSAVYGANHAAYDAAGRNIFYSMFGRTAGDSLYRSFLVQRKNANDATVQNGFYVGINARGEPYVDFTSGGREAWLEGLGVGTVVENDISTAVSVGSGSWKTIGSLALPAGVWVLQYNVVFASNATGRRAVTTSVTRDSAGTTAEQRHHTATQQATNGTATVMGHTAVYNVSSRATTHLNVFQNSGSALNVTGFMRAVRIG